MNQPNSKIKTFVHLVHFLQDDLSTFVAIIGALLTYSFSRYPNTAADIDAILIGLSAGGLLVFGTAPKEEAAMTIPVNEQSFTYTVIYLWQNLREFITTLVVILAGFLGIILGWFPSEPQGVAFGISIGAGIKYSSASLGASHFVQSLQLLSRKSSSLERASTSYTRDGTTTTHQIQQVSSTIEQETRDASVDYDYEELP